MNSEARPVCVCVCVCVCVGTHNRAQEIGIVYLHFESQISRLIFVHYTGVCARLCKFFLLCSPQKNLLFYFFEHGKSLPNAEYITMWIYVNFTYCFVPSSCCHFTWRESALSQEIHSLQAGLATERPKQGSSKVLAHWILYLLQSQFIGSRRQHVTKVIHVFGFLKFKHKDGKLLKVRISKKWMWQ